MVKKLIVKPLLFVLGLALILFVGALMVGVIFLGVTEDTGLARIDVTTENGARITSKEEYVPCTVSLTGAGEEYDITEASAGIRGRGNSTWNWPKKPYRIKFDNKTSLFGEEKNKSWVLLALYMDFSLTKDKLGFTIADRLGTDAFVPSGNYVELYLNGSYQGLYLLTDQVDENAGRTDVKEDFTAEDIAVPFLVELDAYAYQEGEENVAWFTVAGKSYTVKYPEEDERYGKVQLEYIKSYISAVDSLAKKKDVTLSELAEYIDVDAFIDYYIVKEFMGDPEINDKSTYMSKTKDGKLKMGPVWDFDWSAIGPNTSIGNEPDFREDKYNELVSRGNWFESLYNGSPEFREAVGVRWGEVRGIILDTLAEFRENKSNLSFAALRDRVRWFIVRPRADYSSYFDRVMTWLDRRVAFLDEAFAL